MTNTTAFKAILECHQSRMSVNIVKFLLMNDEKNNTKYNEITINKKISDSCCVIVF